MSRSFISTLTESERFQLGLPTLVGTLQHLKSNGYFPLAILDVGANVGDWSRSVARVFPAVPIAMFEADIVNEPRLQKAAIEIGSPTRYSITLLGAEPQTEVNFYTAGTGSSVYRELTNFETKKVSLPMKTLDQENTFWVAPLLLKLDVQGFELQVLLGGKRTLSLCEVVIMEASLLPYNDGAPLIAEVIEFMRHEGFLIFDFCGQLRRESDLALFQTDVVFVRSDSQLRARKKFWLSEP